MIKVLHHASDLPGWPLFRIRELSLTISLIGAFNYSWLNYQNTMQWNRPRMPREENQILTSLPGLNYTLQDHYDYSFDDCIYWAIFQANCAYNANIWGWEVNWNVCFLWLGNMYYYFTWNSPMLSHFAGQLLRKQRPSEAINCVYFSFTAKCNNCTFN